MFGGKKKVCNFELRSNLLTLGKTQINLVFRSLNRNFVAEKLNIY